MAPSCVAALTRSIVIPDRRCRTGDAGADCAVGTSLSEPDSESLYSCTACNSARHASRNDVSAGDNHVNCWTLHSRTPADALCLQPQSSAQYRILQARHSTLALCCGT